MHAPAPWISESVEGLYSRKSSRTTTLTFGLVSGLVSCRLERTTMDVMEGCSMHCLRASWPMKPVAPAITTFMVSLVRRRNDDTSIRDLQVRTMAPGESNPRA